MTHSEENEIWPSPPSEGFFMGSGPLRINASATSR